MFHTLRPDKFQPDVLMYLLIAKILIISQFSIFLFDFFVKNNVFLRFNKLYVQFVKYFTRFCVISHDKCRNISLIFKHNTRFMKKYMVVCAGLCVAMAVTSCKSSESAYRKAYEKAKAQEENRATDQNQGNEEIAVVAPVVEKPASETVVVDNADNVPVRQESLSVVNGAGLKNFSVVVGSFSVQANAEGLQGTLRGQGYDAQVAYNSVNQMYRVVAATFDTKQDAVRSRNELRSQYPDAWLLYNQK